MKINLNDKGQVKVILALAIIVFLSTLILAVVALDETNSAQSESSNISNTNEEDVSIMVCGNNQAYTYNNNLSVGWSDGENVVWHNGGYEESVLTYEAFPQCINSMDPYEVDMNCLVQYCAEIVKLNQLTGEVKTIWTQGEIW